MKTVNIYALTRINDPEELAGLERQMSGRPYFLKIKSWEITGLRALTGHLTDSLGDISALDFYYSFTIPKLGKEFDLLRINRDTVINIELKSHHVSDDRIKYQLQQNRNYLSSLNRSIRSYTYISSEDKLVRLSNSDNLISEAWETLARDIKGQTECIADNIEQFFKEDQYLISPLTDPERFLKNNYFLTSQQKDIKKHILSAIKNNVNDGHSVQGFTGLPGTGKTLLLYDLAMTLTEGSRRVCVLHFGSFPDEMRTLDERLKRIDFYPAAADTSIPDLDPYNYIFVDEGHRMKQSFLDELMAYSSNNRKPVIISYDHEAVISPYERPDDSGEVIDKLTDIIKYRLTNRIRMNSELSSYICCIMQYTGNHRMKSYPSVSLYYAKDEEETGILLNNLIMYGYTYIADNSKATCREFDKVVMVIDDMLYYDKEGFLRSKGEKGPHVRQLFHGLNRAKTGLAIIVKNNPEVFRTLLNIAIKTD